METNQLVGLDIDLATEIAKQLSLKIVWSETPFCRLFRRCRPSARRFRDQRYYRPPLSRRENADFVDLSDDGPQFFVLASSPPKPPSISVAKIGFFTRARYSPVEIEKWSKANCGRRQARSAVFSPARTPSMFATSSSRAGSTPPTNCETLPYALKQSRAVSRRRRAVQHRLSRHHVSEKDDAALRQSRNGRPGCDDRGWRLPDHSRQVEPRVPDRPTDAERGHAMSASGVARDFSPGGNPDAGG